MLVRQSTPSWHDHFRMQITNDLATIDVAPILSLSRQPRQTVMLQAFKRMLGVHSPAIVEHGERTARYAFVLGNKIGLSREELVNLRYAALLHDIGMLTLPKEILEKKGPLTADEYALFQSHPRAGAELLQPISFLHTPALWIAHHHERWDGFGYPYGLRGEFIPLGSRILAVADMFDALTMNRPFGQPQDVESALHLLRIGAGSQLDPELAEVFAGLTPPVFGRDLRSGVPDGG